jgi:non-ribosomal peptide synthetase component E (peptide arylation enzyme)
VGESDDVTHVSFGRRLTELADADPDRPAVTCGEEQVSRRRIDERAHALARDLLRDDAGTVRRGALRAERLAPEPGP